MTTVTMRVDSANGEVLRMEISDDGKPLTHQKLEAISVDRIRLATLAQPDIVERTVSGEPFIWSGEDREHL